MDARAVADLARSGLTPEQAEAAGITFTEDASAADPGFRALPALAIPYFAPDGAPVLGKSGTPFLRVRYLADDPTPKGFAKTKPRRYAQPAGSGVRAYFPRVPDLDWAALLADVQQPLIITEGEKKALAATCAGFITIGLGGVFNYLTEGALIPELAAIPWKGRDVFIIFDSDAGANPNIQAAEARLVDELMRERGARVYIVRLPPRADGSKCGIDDFLIEQGAERLEKLILTTEPLGAMDAAVLALNRHVCLIATDGLVYDIALRRFLNNAFFVRGSKWSAWKVRKVITTGRNPGVKEIPVVQEWLTHPLAQRYDDLLFRPGEGPLVETDFGAPAYNVWYGWQAEPGDVEPFLRLNEYLYSGLSPDLRDYALKLFAWKAQNPKMKTFAPVLVGDQGGGKSLWADTVGEAFAPYNHSMDSKQFMSDFQGWMERTLLAVVHEAEPGHLAEAKEALKSFVTDIRQSMNEKYRVKRQVNCYASFILTSNDRGTGAFSHDDRRMFVVNTAPTHKDGQAFYDPIFRWRNNGGAKHLMHYLLNYDLKGWSPGIRPPMTAEKAMARRESLTEVERWAEDMRTAKEHTVMMWIDVAMAWADSALGGNSPSLARKAQEIKDSYSVLQVRDWYTPEELAQIRPQISTALYGARGVKSAAGEISRQLRNAGIRYLESADSPDGFLHRGSYKQYLVVANLDDWTVPLKQDEFDRVMREWPRYSDVCAARKRARRAPTASA